MLPVLDPGVVLAALGVLVGMLGLAAAWRAIVWAKRQVGLLERVDIQIRPLNEYGRLRERAEVQSGEELNLAAANLGGRKSPPVTARLSVNWFVEAEADSPWVLSPRPNASPDFHHPDSRTWSYQLPELEPHAVAPLPPVRFRLIDTAEEEPRVRWEVVHKGRIVSDGNLSIHVTLWPTS